MNQSVIFLKLNDVKKGGETAFAQAGIRATPVKGSAIFWYNMLSSGDRYEMAHHGGCPVIFGEKFRECITHGRNQCRVEAVYFMIFECSRYAVDALQRPGPFAMPSGRVDEV